MAHALKFTLFYPALIIVALATQSGSIRAAPAPAPPLELAGHSQGVRWIAFAPDGKSLASASDDGNLKIWDLSTGQVRMTIGNLQQGARIVAYSPDGRQLACADGRNEVHIYDAASGREMQHHDEDAGGIPIDMLYLKGGSTLANVDSHSGLHLWLWDTSGKGRPQHRTVAPTFSSLDLGSAVLSPDGKTLAAVDDRQIHVFDLSSGQEKAPLPNRDGAQRLAFSPDNRLLAAPGNSGVTHLWDLSSGREAKSLSLPAGSQPDQISDVSFSPDGRLLIAGGGKLLVVWDVATGKQRFTTQPTDLGQIFSVAISPDNKSLAYGMSVGPVEVINLTGGASAATGNQVTPVALVNDGGNPPPGQLMSGTAELPPVRQLGEQNPPGRLQAGNSLIEYVIFSPDGRTLAAVAGLGVELFDSTGRRIAQLDLGQATPIGLSFTTDGKRLVTVNSTDVAQTWDAATGKQLASFRMKHPEPAPALGVAAVARDGKTVALAGMTIEKNMRSASSVVEIWNIRTGKHRTLSKGDFRSATQMMAFSPDGKLLAVAQQSGPAQIWKLTNNKKIADLPLGQQSMLSDLVFSPDGKMLATEGSDSQVRVWDAANGKQLATTKAENAGPHRLAFTSDGKSLAILDVNQVRLWDYANNREVVGTSGLAAGQSFSTLAASPAGNTVALGVQGDGVELQQLASGAASAAKPGVAASEHGNPPAPTPAPAELFTVKAHDQPIHDLAFSGDGRTLVTAGHDNSLKVWDIPSGKPRKTLGQQWVGWVSISPDGKQIASATDANADTTKLWDAASGRPLAQLPAFGPVEFSPDGASLATGGRQELTLWDVATHRPRLQVRHPYPITEPLVFSSDGKVLAWLDKRAVHLTDTAKGADLAVITGQTGPGQTFNSISHFAFANGRVIVSPEAYENAPQRLLAFDTTGRQLGPVPIDLSQYSITSMKFAPGGRVLALVVQPAPAPNSPNAPVIKNTAGHDEVWLCDATSGQKLAVLPNFPTASGTVVAFSPNGHYMGVGEGLGVLHVYDVSRDLTPSLTPTGRSK